MLWNFKIYLIALNRSKETNPSKRFRFSLLNTSLSIMIAALMITASVWQWNRYLYKKQLVATYKSNSTTPPIPFQLETQGKQNYKALINRKISIKGHYDFEHQTYVINRRWQHEAGYWLFAPFIIDQTSTAIMVSRGFIPFGEYSPAKWIKYNFKDENYLEAVVQKAKSQFTFLSPASHSLTNDGFIRKWLYPDIENMGKQLGYPVVTSIYLQKLGTPKHGIYPAEALSIDVPPSTHFGYTIEWAILALITLVISFLLQAYPRVRKTNKAMQ